MNPLRQQILILCLADSSLESKTVAWSLYDGTMPKEALPTQTGDDQTPPYGSVLEAMQLGWRVIQMSSLPTYVHGYEHDTGHLPYEFVLERMVAVNGGSE